MFFFLVNTKAVMGSTQGGDFQILLQDVTRRVFLIRKLWKVQALSDLEAPGMKFFLPVQRD